ncbi:MAG: 30S ribosome-binding factor RbfA [Phycisphaerales bacterium]|nr:30S ribosome-binding factor RbfA [Phycisphaerales bacterium]
MSRKTEQLASTLQRALQEVIARGLNDPRITGLITITSVRISPDLREAVVMVSVLPEEKQELVVHGLKHAAPHIRREIGENIRSRQLPTLHFRLDESLKKQAAVIRAISQATTPSDPGPSPEVPPPSDT